MSKGIAKIADVMPKNITDKRTRHFETTKPVFVGKLVDEVGAAETARLIGMTDSAISSMLRDGNARVTVELAAEKVWSDKFKKQDGGGAGSFSCGHTIGERRRA